VNICFRALAVALIAIPFAAAAQNAPRGNAENGKRLFETKACFACHGYVGQGSREGPRVAPPMPFPAFLAQMREPRGIMPPYTETILSEQETADIVAYLAALPPPPDHKSIPLLQN
jgi:ubiquinol-cytochrome c reductase cytochrome c subunit